MASPATREVDYLVLSGGSGGLGSARMASGQFGVKTLIVEGKRLGGTCVNVGYVNNALVVHLLFALRQTTIAIAVQASLKGLRSLTSATFLCYL